MTASKPHTEPLEFDLSTELRIGASVLPPQGDAKGQMERWADRAQSLEEQHEALVQDRDEWKLRYEHLFGATEEEIYVRERIERERADGLQEQLEMAHASAHEWAVRWANEEHRVKELKADPVKGENVSDNTTGVIEVAEKIATLIQKAPAGGIFHDATIPTVAGIDVPGFGGMAGFQIEQPDGRIFEVAVKRQR